jgi:hypothetical protein
MILKDLETSRRIRYVEMRHAKMPSNANKIEYLPSHLLCPTSW